MKRFVIIVAALLSSTFLDAVFILAQTVTPNIGLQVPLYNQANWQVPINYDLNRLDLLLSGNLPLPALDPISLQLQPVLVSQLPTCTSALDGKLQAVSDSTTATWGAIISGGGTLYPYVWAYCNGVNWVVQPSAAGGISGLTNPMTTFGDLLYGGTGGVPARLAGNTTTTPKYLRSVGSGGVAGAPTLEEIQASDVAGWTGLGNGATVLDATLPAYAGADMGASISNALNALYAAGVGGTVDARGFVCPANCVVGTSNLTVGNGTVPVKLMLPAGQTTRGVIAATGNSAQILYNGLTTIDGSNAAVIVGPSDVTAVQPVYSAGALNNIELKGFKVQDTGGSVAGSVALAVGGLDPGIPFSATNATRAANAFGVGSHVNTDWFTGALAHFAIYPAALATSRLAAHYAAASSVSAYESAVLLDSPSNYWPMTESGGTTATDIVAGVNGTYAGGYSLTHNAGIDGASYAPVLNGTSGLVTIPSGSWLNTGSFTIEGWANPTSWGPGYGGLFYFGNSAPASSSDGVTAVDWPVSGNLFLRSFDANGNVLSQGIYFSDLTLGQWNYFAFVYASGAITTVYENGVSLPIAADVTQAVLSNIQTSGAATGVLIDSYKGCTCYDKLFNVNAVGTQFGVQTLNHSGYAYGVNSNQWYGGDAWGPVGIYDAGGAKNEFFGLDMENNASNNGGGVLAAQVTSGYSLSALGYKVGDVLTAASGCSSEPTLTVMAIGGTKPALAVTTPGSGCTAHLSGVAVTGGSGTGAEVNLQTSGHIIALESSDLFVSPYEEGGSKDYLCGGFNEIEGPMGSTNGSKYSYDSCPGTDSQYGGPSSNFTWGPGAAPDSIGVGSYVVMGGNDMYDTGPSGGTGVYDLYRDGPQFGGWYPSIGGSMGHSDWNVGLSKPHSGTVATGQTTFGALANPLAPTVTVGLCDAACATGYTYALAYNDGNGGATIPGSFSVSVNGPAALGAWITATPKSGGAGGYHVNDVLTVTGGDGTGQVKVTTIDGSGNPTGYSIQTPGSLYRTTGRYGAGDSTTFATTGGVGNGATITGTTTYMVVSYALPDGVRTFNVLRNGDPTNQATLGGGGWINLSLAFFDFGATSAYSAASRNSTGDLSVAGNAAVGGGSNVVYRCVTAGTLPIGALTITSGDCGSTADTGLRVP